MSDKNVEHPKKKEEHVLKQRGLKGYVTVTIKKGYNMDEIEKSKGILK